MRMEASLEGPGEKDPRTVFIKGISFDWDNADFEKAFSDVGPVRKCFLLKGAGKNHKGCGFVTFALPEDAERAIQDFNGKKLGGRTVQVEAAQRRAPFAERKEKKRRRTEEGASPAPAAAGAPATPATDAGPASGADLAKVRKPKTATAQPMPQAAPQPAGVSPEPARPPKKRQKGAASEAAREKQRLVRTVALGNLTPAVRARAIAYAQSAGEVEAVWEPSPAEVEKLRLQRDGCAGDVVFLAYTTVKDALAGVAALHNHVLQPEVPAKGGDGGGKKPKAAAGAGTVLWARQAAGEGAHLKKWRLILRNLPFQVQEAQLRELLSPAGFVWELTVLRNPDGKARGFAFAGFMCYAHAEKAIKLANGEMVGGRPVAVDWAVPKAQFAATAAEGAPDGAPEGVPAEQAAIEDQISAEEEDKSDGEGQEGAAGEVTAGEAVDSLANLDQEKALLKSVLAELNDEDEGPSQQGAAGKARNSDRANQEGAGARAEKKERKEKRAQSAKADAGAEAAGVPEGSQRQDGAEQEQRAEAAPNARPSAAAAEAGRGAGPSGRGEAAGPSGRADATVFVRGLPLDVLQFEVQERLARFGKLAACRLVMDKGTRKLKGTAFAEYERREDAERAVAACAKARAGQGPQVMVRGRPVEVDMALNQQDVRALAADRSGHPSAARDNRNLYLLKEGLIEEGSAAWEAMSAADRAKRKRAAAEARTKLRSPNFFLSRTRLCLRNLPPAMTEKALKDLVLNAVKERAAKAQPRVHQVKVLRDAAEGPKSGKGKGFAFVELTEHEHALCALRQLNNNPVPFGKDRRPIVEFAIENAQMLKKRGMRSARPQPPAGGDAAEAEAAAPSPRQRKARGAGKAAANAAAAPQAAQPAAAAAAAAGLAANGRAGAEVPASRKQLGKRKRAEWAAERQAKRSSLAGGDAATPSGRDTSDAAEPQGRAAKRARKGLSGAAAAGAAQQQQKQQQQQQQQRQAKPDSRDRAGKGEGASGVTTSGGQKRQSKRARQSDGGASPVQTARPEKGGKPKRRKTEPERSDKLDSLVAQYRAQIFGDTKGKPGGKSGQASMQRWFE